MGQEVKKKNRREREGLNWCPKSPQGEGRKEEAATLERKNNSSFEEVREAGRRFLSKCSSREMEPGVISESRPVLLETNNYSFFLKQQDV